MQASKASYESAEAEVRLAEAEARRYANLVETGDVSRSNYDKQLTQLDTAKARANAAKRQYEAARNAARQNYQGVESAQGSLGANEAQLAIAKKAVADSIIRAPISGFISERLVSVGEFVSTSSKIATLVRVNPIRLQIQVPEADTGRLTNGAPVVATTAALPGRDFEGKVTALNPAIDPNSRAMTVEATFNNSKRELRPGMFATARIVLPDTEDAVMVPRSAVLSDPNTESAQMFVIEDGKARIRVVRLGAESGGQVRIVSGVTKGEKVATSDLPQLYDGAPVAAR